MLIAKTSNVQKKKIKNLKDRLSIVIAGGIICQVQCSYAHNTWFLLMLA